MMKKLSVVAIYLFIFSLLSGCGSEKQNNESKNPPTKKTEEHNTHEHKAPNGGILVELGDEFAHLELVSDQVNHKIILYVFDGSLVAGLKAQQPSIIAKIKDVKDNSEIEFKAVINPLADNTANSSSQYEAIFDFEKNKKVVFLINTIIIKNKIFENIETPLLETK